MMVSDLCKKKISPTGGHEQINLTSKNQCLYVYVCLDTYQKTTGAWGQ